MSSNCRIRKLLSFETVWGLVVRFLALDLRETSIHKQFRSCDVAALVGGEKDHGLRNLVGCAEPAERNAGGNILHELVGSFRGMPWGRAGIARAHGVHANAAMLQVGGPRARERAHGSLGGAVDTPVRRGRFAGGGGRIQDDRGAIRHQGKCLLYREKQSLQIAVEERVVMLLSYLSQGSKLRGTGIREHNIELAFPPLDLCEQAIKIAEVRHISLYSSDIPPYFLYRRRQLCIAAPADVDVRAFVHKLLRRRETNAAIAARDQRRFVRESHINLLLSRLWITVIIQILT